MTIGTRRGNGEGSRPVQRKDGRWQVGLWYLDPDTGQQKRTTVTGKTQGEALKKAREVRKRVNAGGPPRDQKIRLEDFAQQWVSTTLAASDRKPSTKSWYATMIRSHITGSTLGATALDLVKPSSVDRWKADLKAKGLADSTVRSAFTILRAVLDGAVRDKVIATNPTAVVERPKVADHVEADYLTPGQVQQLVAAAAGSRYAPLLVLLVNTGLRRGEALALTWADVAASGDGDAVIQVRGTLSRINGELSVSSPKTRKSRRALALTPAAIGVLAELRQRQRVERIAAGSQWHNTGYVFTTELGEPCDPRNALRALKAAVAKHNRTCEAEGRPADKLPAGLGLHSLRHSAASVMLAAGVPLKVVSEILGHSSIAITADIYGHVAPDVARAAMSTLSDALTGASSQNHVPESRATTVRKGGKPPQLHVETAFH